MMILDALTRVPGFKATGIPCGLKQSGNKDLALITADSPCTWAAVFTTNAFQAAPVLYDRALLAKTGGRGLQAVVINAGNANACTGDRGVRDTETTARFTESLLNLPADSVAVMSTGIIGVPLPIAKLKAGLPVAVQSLSATGGNLAAEAIMTTDTFAKAAFVQLNLAGRPISIGGIAKGSGMIHPNMATMLSTIVTDACLFPDDLAAALQRAVAVSFNRISVDGDTSTNDTVIVMASGQAGITPITGNDLTIFENALTTVCIELAKAIARDGEGATKLVEITVQGAATPTEAALAAAAIATSPLSKTALFGNDPNWGRFLAAAGRSGAAVNPAKVTLWLATPQLRVQLVAEGQPLPFDAVALNHALQTTTDVLIEVNLGVGIATTTYWTCDLSYKYVEINAEYHT